MSDFATGIHKYLLIDTSNAFERSQLLKQR